MILALQTPVLQHPHRYSWGSNHQVIGKCDPQKLSYAGAWTETCGTLADLEEHIGQGHPWMPALLDGNGKRWQSNANSASLLGLDIDEGLDIPGAMGHPYIGQYCGLGIESHSSTPEHHKFRLVFALHEPIQGHVNIKAANAYLAYMVGSADRSCKDASRFFFGALGKVAFLKQDVTLPADFLQRALEWAAGVEAERLAKEAKAKAERLARLQEIESQGGIDLVGLVEQAEQRLGLDAFGVELEPRATGHKQRCKPVFRVGSGSYSAFLTERNGAFLYCDPASDHKAMSGFRFFVAQRHGLGYQARGSEWVSLAREFCAMAGVAVPEVLPSLKPKTDDPVALEQWRASISARARAKWIERRKFSPDDTLDSPRLPAIPMGDVAIKSGLGSGKTHQLAAKMQSQDGGAIMLGSRNGLLLQTTERLNQGASNLQRFTHIHSPEMDRWALLDPNGRVALCLDSLHRFDHPSLFDGKTLILDEATSTVKHLLLGGTLAGSRAKVQQQFAEVVARAGEVVCLDGNLNDVVMDYLETLRGKPILRLENTSQAVQLNVFITVPEKPRDHSGVLGSLLRTMDNGDRCVMVSDSQRLCEITDTLLTSAGHTVFRVDSKTMRDPAFRKMIMDPNLGDALVKAGVTCLILSPSAESGLNVSALEVLDGQLQDYFTHGFAVFYGILDSDSQTQIIRRAREVTDWLIHCPPYSIAKPEGSRSSFEGTLGRSLVEAINLELAVAAMDGEDIAPWVNDLQQCPHHGTRVKLMAQRNHELSNTRECLQLALEAQGHTVTLVGIEVDEETKQLSKSLRQALVLTDSRAIYNAEPIPVELARKLKASFISSLEKHWQIERALLLEKLPEIETTELWTVDLVKACLFSDRNLIRKLQNFWLTHNLDLATNRTRKRIQAVTDGYTVLADLGTGLSKLKYLTDLGIHRFMESGEAYSETHPEVQRIFNSAKRSAKAKAFGIAPGANTKPMKWLGMIVRDYFAGQSEALQDGTGTRARSYVYSPSKWQALSRFIARYLTETFSVQTCISELPESLAGQGLEHEHTPANEHGDTKLGCVRTQSLTGQGFEPVSENKFEHAYRPCQWDGDIYSFMGFSATGKWLLSFPGLETDPSTWLEIEPELQAA